MDEFLSFDEFRFVKSVGEGCNMYTKQQTCWTFHGFCFVYLRDIHLFHIYLNYY